MERMRWTDKCTMVVGDIPSRTILSEPRVNSLTQPLTRCIEILSNVKLNADLHPHFAETSRLWWFIWSARFFRNRIFSTCGAGWGLSYDFRALFASKFTYDVTLHRSFCLMLSIIFWSRKIAGSVQISGVAAIAGSRKFRRQLFVSLSKHGVFFLWRRESLARCSASDFSLWLLRGWRMYWRVFRSRSLFELGRHNGRHTSGERQANRHESLLQAVETYVFAGRVSLFQPWTVFWASR